MKKICLFLLCLLLALALMGCQPQGIENISDVPTPVPGEPEGVPTSEINGAVFVLKG